MKRAMRKGAEHPKGTMRKKVDIPPTGPLTSEEEAWLDKAIAEALGKVVIPPYVPPTPEELERSREAFAEITKLRDRIGPIGMSVTELIRMDRGWPEEDETSRG